MKAIFTTKDGLMAWDEVPGEEGTFPLERVSRLLKITIDKLDDPIPDSFPTRIYKLVGFNSKKVPMYEEEQK